MNRRDYMRPFWCSIALILTLAGTCWAGLKQGEDAYGRGDYQKAAQAFHSAAEQGRAEAQIMLGAMHLEGRGVQQDYVRGHMWLNIAMSTGHKKAGEARAYIEMMMTPEQITEAQRLAGEWVNVHK